MSIAKKKLAAVTSAVITYIKTQEEAAAYAAQVFQEPETALQGPGMTAGGAFPVNTWGMAGRTAHMQVRSLMQMRAFK